VDTGVHVSYLQAFTHLNGAFSSSKLQRGQLVNKPVCVRVCVRARVNTCVCQQSCVCVCVCARVCVCFYACVFMYICKETMRQVLGGTALILEHLRPCLGLGTA
jgi:hypothetical protein